MEYLISTWATMDMVEKMIQAIPAARGVASL
jgi:hypothetical protein